MFVPGARPARAGAAAAERILITFLALITPPQAGKQSSQLSPVHRGSFTCLPRRLCRVQASQRPLLGRVRLTGGPMRSETCKLVQDLKSAPRADLQATVANSVTTSCRIAMLSYERGACQPCDSSRSRHEREEGSTVAREAKTAGVECWPRTLAHAD